MVILNKCLSGGTFHCGSNSYVTERKCACVGERCQETWLHLNVVHGDTRVSEPVKRLASELRGDLGGLYAAFFTGVGGSGEE